MKAWDCDVVSTNPRSVRILLRPCAMYGILRNVLCALCVAAMAMPALAADHGHQPRGHWRGDIRHFHEHDFVRWHGGHWIHGRHAGRPGWWWVVGTIWYWYPTPVYPYPDPYQPPPAAAIAPPSSAVTPQYWYYCADPEGYYPYIPECSVNWQPVRATPR
jgi:hypothetical protein